MKTEQLLRHLRKHGCYLKREERSHSLYANIASGKTQTVPSHSEISNQLAQKICKMLGVPPISK